jgi:hypothetical protein
MRDARLSYISSRVVDSVVSSTVGVSARQP